MARVQKERAATETWRGFAAKQDSSHPRRRRRPGFAVGSGPLQVDADAHPLRLGQYQLLGLLGQGGMARVYLGEHTAIGKRVAIKTLLPEYALCKQAHEVLLREARIASAIRHPHLIDIYDFGKDELGRPYCVMELALVIDFGIAKSLSPSGLDSPIEGIVGTPLTMAPEQISQDDVDERTDIWALGVLLYEMLAGRLPFPEGGTLRDELVGVLTLPPRPLPLDLTPDVRDIVLACLSKDREDRPASSRDLVEQLRAARNAYVARHDSIDQRLAADEDQDGEPDEAEDDPRDEEPA